MKELSRRTLFQFGVASAVCLMGRSSASASDPSPRKSFIGDSFTMRDETVRFYSSRVDRSVRLLLMSDTHLFRDDARGEPFRQYSARMASIYNQTTHFKTGAKTNPEESFLRAIQSAGEQKVDALALLGDIVSFPSEAGVSWIHEHLEESGLNYLYIAGNHDWHYEGLPGTSEELRKIWAPKRLHSLYRGRNPLMYAVDVGAVSLLMIDNSIYEILPEQLEFFRRETAKGKPTLLMMHIPLYAPGRDVDYGCGHPQWSAATDNNWKIEKRPQWPAEGHSQTTKTFYHEVFSTPNLLGVFTGHVHRQGLDVVNGKPQFTLDANANGAFLNVEILPLDKE